MEKELENLNKPKKSTHGGKREGAGRKPLLDKIEVQRVRELIEQHGSEFDELRNKERCLALLDVLYEEGAGKSNITAIKEYFDRQLGKSKETIKLDAVVKTEDISDDDLTNIIDAYGANSATKKERSEEDVG